MSSFKPKRYSKQKPLLSIGEVRALVSGLKSGKKNGIILRYICTRRMDADLEETNDLVEQIYELTDHYKFGEIAEWILRQYINRPGSMTPKLEPTKLAEKIYEEEEELTERKRRHFDKEQSLLDEHLKQLLDTKILKNPKAFLQVKHGAQDQMKSKNRDLSIKQDKPKSAKRTVKRKHVLTKNSLNTE